MGHETERLPENPVQGVTVAIPESRGTQQFLRQATASAENLWRHNAGQPLRGKKRANPDHSVCVESLSIRGRRPGKSAR